MRSLTLPILALAAPSAAVALPPLVIAGTTVDPATGRITVELLAVNATATAITVALPARIDATLKGPEGSPAPIALTPAPGQSASLAIAPSGFARLRYEAMLPAEARAGAVLLAIPDAPAVALGLPDHAAAPIAVASAAPVTPPPSPPSAGSPRNNPFLANLSAYEPTYFVYGPGTDTAGRVQVSLKYQLLGRRGNWLDGITFAYTQRMFWDLERDSSPFRDVNYMPELFYVVPPREIGSGGIALGGRAGARHESNGRSGDASRTLNTVYIQPEGTIPVGAASLTIGPRLWTYVGGRRGNEDIARYRGRTGLYAAFGTDDGARLSLTSRLNIGSGKGAVDAVFSYPLTRIWERGPQFYLIAQGFAGYGEDLLDYNRHQTRARIGIGITR